MAFVERGSWTTHGVLCMAGNVTVCLRWLRYRQVWWR